MSGLHSYASQIFYIWIAIPAVIDRYHIKSVKVSLPSNPLRRFQTSEPPMLSLEISDFCSN